jgi:ribosomal protein S18 acetylase RimI-like enzyme
MVMQINGTTYNVLCTEYTCEAAEVVARGFVDEPGLAACVSDPQQRLKIWRSFVNLFKDECTANGLSIMGVDDASSKMVGCLYVRDYRSPLPSGITEGTCQALKPLIDVLIVADERYETVRPQLQHGDCVDFWMEAVLPEYRGKGIANALIEAGVRHMAAYSFKYIIGECTGAYSAKSFLKSGFVKKAEALYKNCNYPVEVPFPHTGIIIYEKLNMRS